jgi:hypothetical protein
MSKERSQPEAAFGFTEREKLFYRVSEARFQALLEDERITIHRIELSANDYGEFLFVTVSLPAAANQPVGERKSVVTMFGLGLHEFRERWITDEWFWYQAFSYPELLEQTVDKQDAQWLIEERREAIQPYVNSQQQSKRGKLFEMIADMTDDDGTIAEMEDFPDLFDDD